MEGFFDRRRELNRMQRQATGRGLGSRMTGRSLSLALRFISDALAKPGQEIDIIDHHLTYQAKKCLMDQIRNCVDEMKLEGFTFRQGKGERLYIQFVMEY